MFLKITRYVSLTLLVIWMGVIFTFSGQEAEKSSSVSRGVVVKVVEIVYPDYEKLAEQEKTEVIQSFTMPIRKLAHFSEFFILGALALVFFATFDHLHKNLLIVLPFFIGVLYAISDEIHQVFVSGRACRFLDVLIDSSGVLLAVVIGFLINHKIRGAKR